MAQQATKQLSAVHQPDTVKVLVAIAINPNAFTVALKQELTKISALPKVEERLPSSNLQIVILEQPGVQEFTHALEQEQYHILHYIGYPNDQSTRGIGLYNSKTNLTETLNSDGLTRILVDNHIQMAVFQFCQLTDTETEAPTTDVAKLAANLVKDGIKMVLAIPASIPNAVALTLIRLFYQNLSQGYPVDFCLRHVREELIYIYGLEQLYWGLTLLFLEPNSDGYLIADKALSSQLAALDVLAEDWQDDEEEFVTEDFTYEEDAAVISDLFSQLSNPAETISTDEIDNAPEQVTNIQPPNRILAASANNVKLRLILGGAIATLLAMLSWWWFRQPQPNFNSATPKVVASSSVNLQAPTPEITASAISKFNQGDVSVGISLVEELLNRGAHQDVAAVLRAVSPQQANTSDILFLRGRLAWQLHKPEQARQYWEIAVNNKPNTAAYHNALGFAYYALNNRELANEAWFEALYLAKQQATDNKSNTDALNAYAGLALVLHQAAKDQPANDEQYTKLLREAFKLRQIVLADDPVNFQVQRLRKHWLWNQKAIQDWRLLLQTPGSKVES